ncbi:MAG: hypothetical protein HRF47_11490 [Chloroflexota bacterium]|jgi:hypothetical protein
MIKLYREADSPQADAIEAEFREMVLGYDRVVIERQEAKKLFGEETALPVLTDNERMVSGEGIPAYLRELAKLWRDWQLFQGDYCYVDDDGEVC